MGLPRARTESGFHMVTAAGDLLVCRDVHFFLGFHTVIATRKLKASIEMAGGQPVGMRLADGLFVPFDAGYCSTYVTTLRAHDDDTPEAAQAVLATG